MINWGTFMMEVSKTPSVLIGLVFTAITICLTIFNLWWSMRNRVEAEWTVSVTIPRNGSPSVRSRIRIRLTSTNPSPPRHGRCITDRATVSASAPRPVRTGMPDDCASTTPSRHLLASERGE